MRTEFFKNLKEEMQKDESIFFLIGDMGLGLVESIQKEFPRRFLNVGISEQNLIGVSSGLVNAGFKPFCYTISNFLIHRCFEQIRNDICIHKYPITLVGTSTGFDNGLLGPTHHVIDDVGCLKALPEITIYSPGSVNSIKMIFEEIIRDKNPAYIRIGKSSLNISPLANSINHFVIDQPNSDVLIVTHGTALEYCVKAHELNSNFSVYCFNKIKPLDEEKIKELFCRFSKIIVVEEHMVSSGLYNSLCQAWAGFGFKNAKLFGIGVPDVYEKAVGDRNYFSDRYGYSPEKIAKFATNICQN